MLSAKTMRNVEALLVLVSALAASFLLPPHILIPLAAVGLAAAVAGVFVIRAQLQRPEQSDSRRALLLEIAMVLAMAGLAAFVVLLLELAAW